MRRLIDLSLPIFEGMPHYPTDPPTVFAAAKEIVRNRTRVTEVKFGSHTGTHVDVPSHVIEGGKSLEQMDLSSFCGQAVKLRLDRFDQYELQAMEYEGVLLETGWGRCYTDPRGYYGDGRPSIPEAAVDRLLQKGLKFFGCDLPGVDRSGATEKVIHGALFSSGVVIYENLANLGKLPEAVPFTFWGLPLNFQGIDGSPVRAVAVLEREGF
jgi:kynurenine formamidase